MSDENLRQWRGNQKHLPEFMRDFHDCKDLFKALHEHAIFEEGHPAEKVNWVTGQCYTVDMFLWFMAEFGYTLQKNRSKIPFENLQDFIGGRKDARLQALAGIVSKQKTTKEYRE
jgi:hypothetical protein